MMEEARGGQSGARVGLPLPNAVRAKLGKKPWGHQHLRYEQEFLTGTNLEKPPSATSLFKKGGVHLNAVPEAGGMTLAHSQKRNLE